MCWRCGASTGLATPPGRTPRFSGSFAGAPSSRTDTSTRWATSSGLPAVACSWRRSEAAGERAQRKDERVDYDAIVVGSGFGGTVAVSKLVERGKRVLLLERGTWWASPDALGKPPQPPPPDLATWARANGQPVQYFPRPDHAGGLVDLFASIRYSGNRDGLYVYSQFDECNVLHANGVGGGSLIYSTATMRPDPAVLELVGLALSDGDYAAARRWTETNRGLLNRVVTKIPLPSGKDVADLGAEDYLYLDRSRALRDAAAAVRTKRRLRGEDGVWAPLELAIGEYHPTGAGNREAQGAHTFCERQGRCILGCLPPATHSL